MRSKEGVVYFIQFEWFPHCYKVGCTSNLGKRMKTLEGLFGPITLVAYGEAFDKEQVELEIKCILAQYSNRTIITESINGNILKINDGLDERLALCPIGRAFSDEHFVLPPGVSDLPVELLINACNGVVIPGKRGVKYSSMVFDWGVLV